MRVNPLFAVPLGEARLPRTYAMIKEANPDKVYQTVLTTVASHKDYKIVQRNDALGDEPQPVGGHE